MWVTALDSVLEKLKSVGVPFNKIQAISGSGKPTSILGCFCNPHQVSSMEAFTGGAEHWRFFPI